MYKNNQQHLLNQMKEEIVVSNSKKLNFNSYSFVLDRLSYEYLKDAILYSIDRIESYSEVYEDINIEDSYVYYIDYNTNKDIAISYIDYYSNDITTKFVLCKECNIDNNIDVHDNRYERKCKYRYFIEIYNYDCGSNNKIMPKKVDIQRIIRFLRSDLLVDHSVEVLRILNEVYVSI